MAHFERNTFLCDLLIYLSDPNIWILAVIILPCTTKNQQYAKKLKLQFCNYLNFKLCIFCLAFAFGTVFAMEAVIRIYILKFLKEVGVCSAGISKSFYFLILLIEEINTSHSSLLCIDVSKVLSVYSCFYCKSWSQIIRLLHNNSPVYLQKQHTKMVPHSIYCIIYMYICSFLNVTLVPCVTQLIGHSINQCNGNMSAYNKTKSQTTGKFNSYNIYNKNIDKALLK